MNFVNILLILISVISLPAAFLVYFRNPKSKTYISFAAFILIASLWPLSVAFFRMSQDVATALFWDRIIYLLAVCVPSVILYFAHTIYMGGRIDRKLIFVLIAVPLLLIVSLFFGNFFIKEVILNSIGNSVVLGPAYLGWIVELSVFFTIAVILLIKKYAKAKGLLKVQLKFILIAFVLPILGGSAPNAILPLLGNYTLIYVGPLFTFLMAMIIAYAIVKHRLLDIRLVVARSFSYALLLLILGVFYASSLFLSGYFLTKDIASVGDIIISTLIALLMAFTFQPLRQFTEKLTGKIFYKDDYDTNELLNKLTRTMSASLTNSNMMDKVLKIVCDEMKIHDAHIIILKNHQDDIISHNQLPSASLGKTDIEVFERHENKMIVTDELPENALKEYLLQKNISIVSPLKTRNKLLGFLIIESKLSGDIYYQKDIEVFQIFSPELAVAIQNLLAFEQIQQFTHTLEKTVQERTEELKLSQKRALDLKDEFIFIATHDLRTPVVAIDGYMELIRESKLKLDKDNRENFEALEDANERLKQLVNDLLEVARGESGTLRISIGKVNTIETIKNIVSEVSPAAEENSLKLEAKFDEVNPEVMADKQRLSEIMENLLSNAVKFSKKGGKVLVTTEKNGDYLDIAVKDTGYGIPKDQQAQVFQKFFKYRAKEAMGVPGTGLGLFVVKMLADKMQGKVSFVSDEGEGTTFIVSLPLAKS